MISLVANTLPVVLRDPEGYRQAQNNCHDWSALPSPFLNALFGGVSSLHRFKHSGCVWESHVLAQPAIMNPTAEAPGLYCAWI